MNLGKIEKRAKNREKENPHQRKTGSGASKKRRLGGIRVQLVLSFIVPVIFVVLTGVISYQKAAKGMEEKYTESTIQALNMIAEYLDYGCEMVEAEGFKYAYDTQLSSYYMGLLNKKEAEKATVYNKGKDAIRNSALVNPMIQGIYIITGKGMDTLVSGTQTVQNGFVEEWKAAEEVKSGWHDDHAFLDEKMGLSKEDYVLSYYCLSDGGKACVVVDLKAEEIKSILDKMELGEDCVTAFVTPDGKEVLSVQQKEVLSDPQKEDLSDTQKDGQIFQQDFYRQTLDSAEMSGAKIVNFEQDNYLFLYSKSEKTGSTVCVLVPEKQIMGQTRSIRTLTIVLVLIASTLALLLGGWISGRIQKKMKRMVKTVEKVAQGDLTVTAAVKGHDEFAVLADALNKMILGTKLLLDKMQKTSLQLEDSNEKVNEVSEEIGHHSRSIRDALDEISKGMEIQSVSAAECLEKSNCLSDDIKLVSEEILKMEHQMDQTETRIEKSMKAIDTLDEKSQSASKRAREAEESIFVLREHTDKIENFVNMINDIAKRTNLLSLNASIEAVRAGEAGRGFAVVAEEIRDLAGQSVQSAAEIGKNVEIINRHMEDSVSSVQEARSIVGEQRDCVLEMLRVFDQMKTGMEQMFEALGVIVKRVRNVDENRQENLTSISSISSVIEETTTSVDSVAKIAEQLMIYIGQLDDMSLVLNGNMGELKNEVEKFRVE